MRMWWVKLGLISCYIGLARSTGQIRNPCSNGGEMYNPYPGNPAKYIQCSEWGRAFIMDCPPNHMWQNEHKTCVDTAQQGNDMSGGGNTLPSGRNVPQQHGAVNGNRAGMSDANNVHPPNRQMNGNMNGNNGRMNNGQTGPRQSGQMNGNANTGHDQVSGEAKTDMSDRQGNGNGAASATENGGARMMNMQMYMKMMKSMGYKGMSGKSYHVTKYYQPAPKPKEKDPEEKLHNTDLLNPCGNPQLKYIPHPANPTRYFECIGGHPKEKSCPEWSIWRQEHERCQHIPRPQPKPQPTQPPVEKSPKNPCMGSQQKYWPYTADPRKYVECQGWYELPILRSCDPGKIWVQMEMKCVFLNTPPRPRPTMPRPTMARPTTARPRPTRRITRPPPTTTTTPLPPTSTQSTTDFCLTSDSFYHPYAPDSTKYIQCDEYGNMYIRYCGPKKRWEDGLKTCIGDNNVTTSTPSPAGEAGAGVAGSASSSSALTGGSTARDFANSLITNNPCPDGQLFDPNSGLCVPANFNPSSADLVNALINNNPCSNNEVFDPTSGRCIDVTELVSLTDGLMKLQCPEGYKWNPVNSNCEQYEEKRDTTVLQDYNYGPSCQDGYLWDTTLGACVEAVHVKDMISAFGNLKDADAYFLSRYPNLRRQGSFDQEGNFIASDDLRGQNQGQNQDQQGAPLAIPEYTGENPCGTLDSLYYPFPGDARFFIQCDLAGAVYVQPCSPQLYWNQDLLTCTAYNAQDYESEDEGDGGDADNSGGAGDTHMMDAASLDVNPCLDSREVYHPHPTDKHHFIICTGKMPFIMACSESLMWNDKTNTCDWPVLEPEEPADAADPNGTSDTTDS